MTEELKPCWNCADKGWYLKPTFMGDRLEGPYQCVYCEAGKNFVHDFTKDYGVINDFRPIPHSTQPKGFPKPIFESQDFSNPAQWKPATKGGTSPISTQPKESEK